MDAIDNEQNFQSLIDVQYTLLKAEQTQYALYQTQLASMPLDANPVTPSDATSVSRGGLDGNEQYTRQSVSQKALLSATRLKEISEELKRLMALKHARFPKIRVLGGNCYY